MVIVGGSYEAERYFGIEVDDKSDFLPVAKALRQRFPRAHRIVTTLRGTISASHNTYTALLWDGETLHSSPTYEITHIVDRVGGGDSFMGALIHGLLKWPEHLSYALRFAVAASTLKHTIPGDVNLVSEEEVIDLMEGDGSGRVRR